MSTSTLEISEPTFEKGKSGQAKAWYLSFRVPVLNQDGSNQLDPKGRPLYRRRRLFFATKRAALAERESMLLQAARTGVSPTTLSPQAVEEYGKAKALARNADLCDVARFWLLHHPKEQPKQVGALIDEFVGTLKKLERSRRHIRDVSNRLNGPFREKFGSRFPETITRREIVEFLRFRKLTRPDPAARPEGAQEGDDDGKKPASGRTILNERNTLTNFFNDLVSRELIDRNPAAGIRRRELPRVAVKEIGFLGLDEVKRYLRACERYAPELVAHEIIQLFAGVRSDDEMADFEGRFVLPQTQEVVIPADVSKTQKREVIGDLEPVFWKWWGAYGRAGILRPKNYGPRWDRVRVLAAIEDEAVADQLAALPIKTLLKRPESEQALAGWPWNARRRTFCTYHVAKHQSAALTALILRHRGSAATLHNSYRGLGVTKEMGEAYFRLGPRPVGRPILPKSVPRGIVRLQMEAGREMTQGGRGNE